MVHHQTHHGALSCSRDELANANAASKLVTTACVLDIHFIGSERKGATRLARRPPDLPGLRAAGDLPGLRLSLRHQGVQRSREEPGPAGQETKTDRLSSGDTARTWQAGQTD